MVPLFVVILNVIKPFLIDSHRSLSYGYLSCFVSSNLDRYVFFILPVSLIFSVNFYFLLVSVLIRLHRKQVNEEKFEDADDKESGDNDNEKAIESLMMFMIIWNILTGDILYK